MQCLYLSKLYHIKNCKKSSFEYIYIYAILFYLKIYCVYLYLNYTIKKLRNIFISYKVGLSFTY